MREKESLENTENSENWTPSLQFRLSITLTQFHCRRQWGNVAALSLEIVATDIFLGDNEGAVLGVGRQGVETKNASCSEPELWAENVSCSELRSLQLPGVQWSYIWWSLPDLRVSTRLAKLICHDTRVICCALPRWQWLIPTRHWSGVKQNTEREFAQVFWPLFF